MTRHPLAPPIEQMLSDAAWKPAPMIAARPWKGPFADAIFVTGATGFVAPFVIDALTEEDGTTIVCLVRAKDDHEARARCVARFAAAGLGHLVHEPRLHFIAGDLAEPRMGLSPKNYESLADSVSEVFHFGSIVNWFTRYRSVRPADVLGTQRILRFAATKRIKRVHIGGSLASRAAAIASDGIAVMEDEPLTDPSVLVGGYCQSKWVIERVCATARAAGIPVHLFRLGDIKGVATTGIGNGLDFGYSLMTWCLRAGVAPVLPYRINYLPVDEVATSIVEIARRRNDFGERFQFTNPEHAPWTHLLDLLDGVGRPLERLELTEFTRRLLADKHSAASRRLRPSFRKIRLGGGVAPVSFLDIGLALYSRRHDTHNTAAALPGRPRGVHTQLIRDGLLARYVEQAARLEA